MERGVVVSERDIANALYASFNEWQAKERGIDTAFYDSREISDEEKRAWIAWELKR